MGATIIDGMDTLHLMGLKEEFAQGREWIENSLNFNDVRFSLEEDKYNKKEEEEKEYKKEVVRMIW